MKQSLDWTKVVKMHDPQELVCFSGDVVTRGTAAQSLAEQGLSPESIAMFQERAVVFQDGVEVEMAANEKTPNAVQGKGKKRKDGSYEPGGWYVPKGHGKTKDNARIAMTQEQKEQAIKDRDRAAANEIFEMPIGIKTLLYRLGGDNDNQLQQRAQSLGVKTANNATREETKLAIGNFFMQPVTKPGTVEAHLIHDKYEDEIRANVWSDVTGGMPVEIFRIHGSHPMLNKPDAEIKQYLINMLRLDGRLPADASLKSDMHAPVPVASAKKLTAADVQYSLKRAEDGVHLTAAGPDGRIVRQEHYHPDNWRVKSSGATWRSDSEIVADFKYVCQRKWNDLGGVNPLAATTEEHLDNLQRVVKAIEKNYADDKKALATYRRAAGSPGWAAAKRQSQATSDMRRFDKDREEVLLPAVRQYATMAGIDAGVSTEQLLKDYASPKKKARKKT